MAALDMQERQRLSSLKHKRYGLAFLAIPTAIVTMFAVGEAVGGDEGWWGHLIQLAIAVAMFLGAWYAPKIGGPVLIAASVAFAWWTLSDYDDLASELSTLAIVGLPLLISGVFFTLAGYRDTRT